MIKLSFLDEATKNNRLLHISFLLLLNLAGFLYHIKFFIANGYLAGPFIFDTSDTFMDFFNPLYWAYEDGKYTQWRSIYPPLNFSILRLLNFLFSGGVFHDAKTFRENSTPLIYGLLFIYATAPAYVLSLSYWHKFSRNEKVLIYFCTLISAPALFALERGNLIILTPIFLALTLSTIGLKRAFFIAMLVNIKPYFFVLIFYYVVKRDWQWLTVCVALAGFTFILFGLYVGDNYLIFFENILTFTNNPKLVSIREVLSMPSSMAAYSIALKHPDISLIFRSYSGVDGSTMANIIQLLNILALLGTMITIFIKSKLISGREALAFLTIFIVNLGFFIGGYSMILYVALIPILTSMRYKFYYSLVLALLAAPLDVISFSGAFVNVQLSYLSGNYVNVFSGLTLGALVRPFLNIFLLLLMAYEVSLRDKEFFKFTRNEI